MHRRFIYLFVACALALPLIFGWILPPAQMSSATAFYSVIDKLQYGEDRIVLISADFGPGTQAENEAQAAVTMEHLMRKRIPFMLISTYQLATPFLESLPKKVAQVLHAEDSQQEWIYGKDWVNLGYQPNGLIMIEGFARADDIHQFIKTDAFGTLLSQIPVMQNIHKLENIELLAQFTGLVGVFSSWVQYFQARGYRPAFVHGCTSITIPEAFIYFDSQQILGLHEGIAGAAWYEKLLSDHYPQRKQGIALRNNTSLAYGHLLIIMFVVFGNLSDWLRPKS